MASAASTYDERLKLVDTFEEYKDYFSKAHFLLLVEESLELNQGGAEKLQYILGLASRCKTGVVSIELLARQIDKEYSLPLLLQEQNGGAEGGREQEDWVDMETDNDEEGGQEDEQEDGEEEVPHVSQEIQDLIAKFGAGLGFFSRHMWRATRPFVVPGEGYWLDTHRIERLRTSTAEDFDIATPMPMPVYIKGNPWKDSGSTTSYNFQAKCYHLCRKVAVSTDGKIYRATNAEIERSLLHTKSAPSTDGATYVKAVQELRRRHAITTPA